jgi:hypothetical protein
MLGDQDAGGPKSPPEEPAEEVMLVVYDLVEALTALGNFIAAAAQVTDAGRGIDDDVRKALAGALAQYERATADVHQLRLLLTRQR